MTEQSDQLRSSGKTWIDLSISNPTRVGLALPDPFEIAPLAAHGYAPQAAGAAEARSAIATYYQQEFGAEIAPDRILLTTSTSEAYSYCFKLVADPGDTILVPQPSYPLLQFLIEAEGLVAKPYPLHYAGGEWILDRDRLKAACDASTRAIIIVSPNNPTGHFLSTADLDWLVEFSNDQYWLISDEVFADYAWTGHPRSATQLKAPNCLVLSGLSKICALPQMKLGWIVRPEGSPIGPQLEWIADTYLSVSSPIERASPHWLAARSRFQHPIQTRCREGLATIERLLKGSAWTLLPVEAGWAAIVRGPDRHEEEDLALRLLESGFSAHPGFYYDLPFQPSFVISLLTPPDDLESGLAAILAI